MAAIIETVRNTIAENFGGAAHNAAAAAEHQFSADDVPDLSNKVAVVTGGTEGIGYAVSRTLLARNIAHLHWLSPSHEVADNAREEIKKDLGGDHASRITWHQIDMSDWVPVQKVGKIIASSHDRLDILVNNAGRGIMTYQVCEKTGIDRHMSVNHFGHVILTSTLLPLMKKTAEQGHVVRISNQASNAHQGAPSDTSFKSIEELNQDLGPNGQYGRSKLATILYTRYLAAQLMASYPQVLVNATHPGVVHTTMSTRDIHEPYPVAGYAMSHGLKPIKKDQWEGAASTLFAATKTERSGEYICPPAVPEPGSNLSQDRELGNQLMELTRAILTQKMSGENWSEL